MLMRLVLVMFRSVFTLFIDIFVKGGAMISGFLLGVFLYSNISTISQELPTFYLIIIIGLCLLSTYLLSRLIEIVPDCLSIILLFIMSTLAVICIFLSMLHMIFCAFCVRLQISTSRWLPHFFIGLL